MLWIDVITLFPIVFDGIARVSMWKKAQDIGAMSINIWNLRDFSRSKQYKVDAPPFGGGPGMVLRVEPLFAAVEQVKSKSSWVINLSPGGKPFSHRRASALAKKEHLIFLCGHYEGIDQRVINELVDEEISIGDYVLTGGEIASMVVIDAIIRFLPGVLGDSQSLKEESFSFGLLEYPHYTKPRVFRDKSVPDVLLSGDHNQIKKWRDAMSLYKTKQYRPDLLERRR